MKKRIGLASTVKHLHLELELRGVPHGIIVVGDGSTDATRQILQKEHAKFPQLKPSKNEGPQGISRDITKDIDAMTGDAMAIMMAADSP